jgi:hypothetical protein
MVKSIVGTAIKNNGEPDDSHRNSLAPMRICAFDGIMSGSRPSAGALTDLVVSGTFLRDVRWFDLRSERPWSRDDLTIG